MNRSNHTDGLFFSVVIPTYNRAAFLKIALESLERQTIPEFECLVIDDGSTDNTAETVRSLDDPRFRYIVQPHQGAAAARNRGVKEARGRYICFLDSDDRFHSSKLETTLYYIKKYPLYHIFHSEELWYRLGSILPQKNYHKKPDGNVFEQALRICCISMSTACIAKNIFDEIGLFDQTMPACEDYDFWLRATARYPVKLIPKILTFKEGGHPDQLSRKYPAMDTLRIRALEKLLANGALDSVLAEKTAQELIRKCRIYITGARKRGNDQATLRYSQLIKTAETYVG